VGHIRNERICLHIFKQEFIHTWPTSGGISPHDVLELVGINVVSNKQKAVDLHATLISEDEITKFLAELLRVCVESFESLSVDFDSCPNHLRLIKSEDICNREAVVLKQLTNLRGRKSPDHCVRLIWTGGSARNRDRKYSVLAMCDCFDLIQRLH
jgi:hypothetical protein